MGLVKKNILTISGSVRQGASSQRILQFIKSQLVDYHVDIYNDIGILPHFNPDIENDQLAESVLVLRHKIKDADAIIICSPEYVFSLPGVLKNTIEWMVSTTLFSNKPVATIIAAASGEKALESIKLIMRTIEARLPDTSTLLIKGVRGKINEEGHITDEATKTQILKTIQSLIVTINDDQGKPTKYQDN